MNFHTPVAVGRAQAAAGIGLALSRQIAEGHGGTLTLANRREGKGCEARVRLPLEH